VNHDLSGIRVLVTGASSGLGAGFAKLLAAQGAAVAVAARRVDRLECLVDAIRADGGRAVAVELDVNDVVSIGRGVEAAQAALGPIDVLLNNAGISATHRLEDVTADEFDAIFATNLRGAFFVAQHFARCWLERRVPWGAIVNVASSAGLRPLAQIGPYAASKAALIHLTKSMALEWGRHGLNSNALCPGYVHTDINDAHWNSDGGKKLVQRLPRQRLGQVDDVSGALVLLCSPASRFINGVALAVDDGLSV
jgi:NAD(P)-dependent dehydrogenase (short-subunit alcohol dehydrogenase family)